MSPDGQTLAYTPWVTDRASEGILLFDVPVGTVRHRLDQDLSKRNGRPGFSPDSRYYSAVFKISREGAEAADVEIKQG